MAQKTMIQAITDALAVEMENDKEILVFGEDVGKNGGVSVQQKVYKKNSAKIVSSIPLLLNLVSAAWLSV